MTQRARATHRTAVGIAAATRAGIVTLGILLAAPASAVDLDELTVVTLARNGAWGVATAASTGEAISAAIGACRAMAGGVSDCGAHFTTTRGRWVIASLCGDHQIIVGADTRQAAETATLEREAETRRVYVPNLPACRPVLTVDPGGAISAGGQPVRQSER